MCEQQTILLTGATGFLGSHLLEALLEKKHEIIILKRSTSDIWRIKKMLDQVTYYELDKTNINHIFNNHQIDLIIHLATFYQKFEDSNDVPRMISANIGFPSELLMASINHNIKGFINTGTFFEYDCSKSPIDESTNTYPFNFYAQTKSAFETILKHHENQLCINTLKIFSPFGEKDNLKLLPTIIKKGICKEKIQLSEGLQKIDLIYAKDIADAYIKAIERMISRKFHPEYEIFNIGSGQSVSIRDIVSLVEEELGYRLDVEWGEASNKDIPIAYAKIDKAEKLLRWTPRIGIKQGIRNCINYYKERNDI